MEHDDEIFQQFKKLLEENGRTGQAQDLSLMVRCLDGMEHQYDAVLQELQAVKTALAQMTEQQAPAKPLLARMVEALEATAAQARDRLAMFRNKVTECAKNAADRFKDAGVSALDRAITAMGVKNGLEHLQEGLQSALEGIKDAIETAEEMGRELRSAGGHLKNAGRAMIGKETRTVEGGQEGRFQTAVLAPMRGAQKLLSNINNTTLAAIGVAEALEQSAGMARDRLAEPEEGEKPSILRELASKKAELSVRATPGPEKEHKPTEAAL